MRKIFGTLAVLFLMLYVITTSMPSFERQLALPKATNIRIVERDSSWDGLEHALLALPTPESNAAAARRRLNRTSVAIIVPHLSSPQRERHREFWRNAGADVHLFVVDVDAESITHVRSGSQWDRVSKEHISPARRFASDSSALRQSRQFADFYSILSFVEREQCFRSAFVMLSDDDVRPCACLEHHMRQVVRWLDESVTDWRLARFSVGTNGLLMRCAALSSLVAFLGARWLSATPATSNFTHAIDYEIALWAMPWLRAPPSKSREYVSRYTLLEHEVGASTLWSGRRLVQRMTPLCMQPLVWHVGPVDVETSSEHSSFDGVHCDAHLVSPCVRADTPRRERLHDDGKCRARDAYARDDTGEVSDLVQHLHVLLARAGESCDERCVRAHRQCDAQTAFVVADAATYSHALPAKCVLVQAHSDAGVGSHLKSSTWKQFLSMQHRTPACRLEVISCVSRLALTEISKKTRR
jgi:hypothetical protein